MALFLGQSEANYILGDTQVEAMYMGDTMVWPTTRNKLKCRTEMTGYGEWYVYASFSSDTYTDLYYLNLTADDIAKAIEGGEDPTDLGWVHNHLSLMTQGDMAIDGFDEYREMAYSAPTYDEFDQIIANYGDVYVFMGCDDGEGGVVYDDENYFYQRLEPLTITPSVKLFPWSGSSAIIKVVSGHEWELRCNANWLNFSVTSGDSGTTNVVVTANQPAGNNSASTVVTAKTTDDLNEKYCVVTQMATAENNKIITVFETTTANERVSLVKNSNNLIVGVSVDGGPTVEYSQFNWDEITSDKTSYYVAPTAGRHYVEFKYSGTTMPDRMFGGQNASKAIYIGEGLTNLNGDCFTSNNNLNDIYIPYSITGTGRANLYHCDNVMKLYGNTIDDLYYSINGGLRMVATSGIGANVVVPEGITRICDYAFAQVRTIETLDFPTTLTSISNTAPFEGNNVTHDITFRTQQPPTMGGQHFTYYGGTLHVPMGCTSNYTSSDWNYLITDYGWNIEEYFTYFVDSGGTLIYGCEHEIPAGQFSGSSISALVITNDVYSIGDYAFADSSIEKITIFGTKSPTLGTGVFSGVNQTVRVGYLPSYSAAATTFVNEITNGYSGEDYLDLFLSGVTMSFTDTRVRPMGSNDIQVIIGYVGYNNVSIDIGTHHKTGYTYNCEVQQGWVNYMFGDCWNQLNSITDTQSNLSVDYVIDMSGYLVDGGDGGNTALHKNFPKYTVDENMNGCLMHWNYQYSESYGSKIYPTQGTIIPVLRYGDLRYKWK